MYKSRFSFVSVDIKSVFIVLFAVGIFTIFPSLILDALANSVGADDTALATTMCKIIDLLTGNLGKGAAAFAIIFIGFGLFVGKISWGMAVATGLGIGCIFGAPTIVQFISPSSGAGC